MPEGKPLETPLRASLSLSQVGLDGLKKFLATDLMNKSSGFLSGDGQLASQSGNMSAVGKLKLEQARMNNLDIGYPIALDYDVADKIDAGIVTINNATLHLGQTPISLAGSVNIDATPPQEQLPPPRRGPGRPPGSKNKPNELQQRNDDGE